MTRSERWYRWLDRLGRGRPGVAAAVDTVIGCWELAKLTAFSVAGLLGGFYLTVAPGWNKLLGLPCIAIAYAGLGRMFGAV